MAKRRIIITESQLQEICGENGDYTYFDGEALNPDKEENFTEKTVADGALEKGTAANVTTDDYANALTNDWRGNAKLHGMGPITVREEEEHGNARLNNMSFGEQGRSYDAVKQAAYRQRQAMKKLRSNDPQTRRSGMKTLKNMSDSGIKKYDIMRQADKTIQSSRPEGTKIKSSPKETGNGAGHEDNGVFLN